jgi:CubicO group peptidase (beta-lactamase class C family)
MQLVIRNRYQLFLILLTFFIGCTSYKKDFIPDSHKYNDYRSAIDYSHAVLNKYMKNSGTIGMSVAVVDNDKIVYSESFGYADKDSKKKVTDSTAFMIGSITKLFTATAIMQLVEASKVALDSPITTYIPEFTISKRFTSRAVTVRDLLIHESGLPSDIFNGFITGETFAEGIDTLYRTVPSLLAKEFAAHPPRTVSSYSNISFSLLGNIIERAGGKSYSQFLQENIFDILHMNNTAITFNKSNVSNLLSNQYMNKQISAPYFIRDIPAGAIVSNVLDMSLFLKMLFADGTPGNQHILNANTLNQMFAPQNGDIPLDFDTINLTYWSSNPSRVPQKVVHHAGNIGTFSSFLIAIPDIKLGVIVLTNSLPTECITPSVNLLETFYQAKTGSILPKHFSINNNPIVKLSEKRLQELAGDYQSAAGQTKLILKKGTLEFDFFGKQLRLIPHSDSTFSVEHRLLGIIPVAKKRLEKITIKTHTIHNKNYAIMSIEGDIMSLVAEKFDFQEPPKDWLNRVGLYTAINDNKVLCATDKNAEKYKRQDISLTYDSTTKDLTFGNTSIKAISSTDAITRGFGRNAGETVRIITENSNEYIWAWGYKFQRKSAKSK